MTNGSKLFISSSVCFIVGGVIAWFGSKYFYKKKYEDKADQEIDSVRKAYENSYYNKKNEEDKKNNICKQNDESKVTTIEVEDSDPEFTPDDYNKYFNKTKKYSIKDPVKNRTNKIYVITEEEFARSECNVQTLVFYKDGILADDDFNIIKNVEETIGSEALSSFGEFKDDAVYVRNELLNIDYEILLDDRTYIEANPDKSAFAPVDE